MTSTILPDAAERLAESPPMKEIFDRLETVVDILKDNVRMLEAAHARHLTACASVAEDEKTRHEEART